MFELKLIFILLGVVLQLIFWAVLLRPGARAGDRDRRGLFPTKLCLFLGAGLVLAHAVLARDAVLFVGQILALVLQYRLLIISV